MSNCCTATFMTDGSGVAFYNNISGNSAFLNINCNKELSNNFLTYNLFTAGTFHQMLGVDEKVGSKYLKWLLNNRFIECVEVNS